MADVLAELATAQTDLLHQGSQAVTYPGWEITLVFLFLLVLGLVTYGMWRLLMGGKKVSVLYTNKGGNKNAK